MKTSRHAKIQEIIKTHSIETQEELAQALESAGFQVTQATVSRDIKEMMLIKVPNAEGGYRYAYPREMGNMLSPGRLQRTIRDAVLEIRSGENIVVLHTMPGTAQGVAFAIDYAKWPEVLGTVAGDDTIFVAIDKTGDTRNFVERIQKLMLKHPQTIEAAALTAPASDHAPAEKNAEPVVTKAVVTGTMVTKKTTGKKPALKKSTPKKKVSRHTNTKA